MALSKTTLFDKELQVQARYFKALGHPARLAILLYLAKINACMTGDIAEELPLSRTTVNQHLKELRQAGLIRGSIQGARKNYCLDPKVVEFMKQNSMDYFSKISSSQFSCD